MDFLVPHKCVVDCKSSSSLLPGNYEAVRLGPQKNTPLVCRVTVLLEETKAITFANDTNLSTNNKTVKELESQLNVSLGKVHQWLCCNKLTLSKDKTIYDNRIETKTK